MNIRDRRLYISGPVRGRPDMNRPAFKAAAERAEGKGWVPVNPLDLKFHDPDDIREVMAGCIDSLLRCGAIYMLEFWHYSDGARAEFWTAMSVGMKAYYMTGGGYLPQLEEIGE